MYKNKPIIFKHDGEEYKAKVLMYEPEIGLSIVDRDDEDNFLYCGIGPLAPNFTTGETELKTHNALVPVKERMIEEGVFDTSRIIEVIHRFGRAGGSSGPSAKTCAFGQ